MSTFERIHRGVKEVVRFCTYAIVFSWLVQTFDFVKLTPREKCPEFFVTGVVSYFLVDLIISLYRSREKLDESTRSMETTLQKLHE